MKVGNYGIVGSSSKKIDFRSWLISLQDRLDWKDINQDHKFSEINLFYEKGEGKILHRFLNEYIELFSPNSDLNVFYIFQP